MKLQDKVAIITGGGSGLGKATALLYAKEGAKVAVTDVVEKTAKSVADEIKKAGGQSIGAGVDVSNRKEIEALVKEVLSKWNKVDILVNSAGIGTVEWFAECDGSTWDKVIDINLKGTLFFTHAVINNMIEHRYGKIINIASAAAIVGAGRQVVYAASKGGVTAFTKSLAREVARYHINVNAICPGPIETPMFEHLRQEDQRLYDVLLRGIAWKRLGKPEEIANAALFLASDDSEFITGHSLLVDGGVTMI
jgi:2-hydroxycyclohexanecarboxyl-CoA dehydrogenase